MRVIGALLLGLAFGSCSLTHQEQMEKVAKDWAITIRASQVIPVYPMTEDLEPGDVFIVTTPLTAQRQEWNDRGYMPLPNHVARIGGLDYDGFYAGSFGTQNGKPFPHWWRANPEKRELGGTHGPTNTHKVATNWPDAPRAFFPTYTFEVESGAGLAAAFPVYGVPVGLSLMGAKKASGSVTIRDAFTFGVSLQQLRGGLNTWLNEPGTRAMLMSIKKGTTNGEVYVRVVSRVFLAGSVAIAISNEDAFSAGLDVGAPKETANPFFDEPDPEPYAKRLEQVNGRLNAAMPGGSLRITHATRRSVTAIEQFDRPMVIGYLAFDFAVLTDGGLSEAISTVNMLQWNVRPQGEFTGPSPVQRENAALLAAYKLGFEDEAETVLDAVARHVGGSFLKDYAEAKAAALGVEGTTGVNAAREAIQEAFDNATGTDFPRRFNTAFEMALTE